MGEETRLSQFCLQCGKCCEDYLFVMRDKDVWEHFFFRFGGNFENTGVKIELEREGYRIKLTFKQRCRFLTEDGKCLIYANRPETCRGYWCEGVRERFEEWKRTQ